MISIISAKYISDYKIELLFSDGSTGIADLNDLIHNDRRMIFRPLRDKNLFKNFSVDYTIAWGGDIDLAPEYLYFAVFKSDPLLQGLFQKWGYVA